MNEGIDMGAVNYPGKTVMVIDNNRGRRESLSGLLEKEGFKIKAFDNADAAATALDVSDPPALVITSIFIPGTDGWRLCRFLRAPDRNLFNSVPILLISSAFPVGTGPRIMAELGANSFLSMPAEKEQIMDEVLALVKGQRERARLNALIIEGPGKDAQSLERSFRHRGFSVDRIGADREALGLLSEKSCNIIVMDLECGDGKEMLEYIRRYCPLSICIVLGDDNCMIPAHCGISSCSCLPGDTDAGRIVDLCDRMLMDQSLTYIKGLLEKRSMELSNLKNRLYRMQKIESLGRMASYVIHDFNNMIGIIMGNAEIALEHIAPEHPVFENLYEIMHAAERSAELSGHLLSFIRRQDIIPEVVNPNEIIKTNLKMIQRLIGTDISINWKPGDDIWPVRINPSQIEQILINLCLNARDAIQYSGRIDIETGNIHMAAQDCQDHRKLHPGEYVMITVSDNGCGMNSETLNRLFEPFYTTKAADKGTGLGMASAYGIVKQNNGSIKVVSEPGHGTTFRIYLPRYRSDGNEIYTEGIPAYPDRTDRRHILLLEGDPAILNMDRQMLERLGYGVLAASSPEDALRTAREHIGEIHLFITDATMADMKGRDLADAVKSLHTGLKRLLITDASTGKGGIDRGDNVIQRPFSLPTLASRVREVLDGEKVS